MRCNRLAMTFAVALAVLLVPASVAAAGPGLQWPRHFVPVLPKVPASTLVVKTAAMLPGANYPWVQPLFVRGLTTLRADIRVPAWTQPPASIPISA
jgi:hypothetical protein